MRTFGEILREKRKAMGLTQLKMAKELGIKNESISIWERHNVLPNTYTLIELADFFGCSLDELVGRKTNDDTCICCGEPIPEGRQVCKKCEVKTNDFD